jgi:hypothetical protein
VHEGRIWKLNIKVKERPFAEGSRDLTCAVGDAVVGLQLGANIGDKGQVGEPLDKPAPAGAGALGRSAQSIMSCKSGVCLLRLRLFLCFAGACRAASPWAPMGWAQMVNERGWDWGWRKKKNRERLEGSGFGSWTLVLKRFHATNTDRHVLAFRRVCSYHGVHSFVFAFTYHGGVPFFLAKLMTSRWSMQVEGYLIQ